MTREEIILSYIKRDGLGLEIGAGCAPIAPKKQGFRVHVLDHCDKALVEIYRPHGINVDNIEEVDFIWDGWSYTELVGRRHVYDWIIGSHVDHFRPLTGIGRVIDAGRNPQRIHSAGTAMEYFLTVVSRGHRIAWDANEEGEFKLVHSLEEAKQAVRDVSERGNYLDLHEWCFTPTSFRLMMRDLFELGLIQLKELAFHPSQGSEFFIALFRSGALPPGTRLELLEQILREQSVV